MGMVCCAEVWREICWFEGGMPVTGSSFVLRVLIDHEGVMRRSDDEFSETTCKGTSAMSCRVQGLPAKRHSSV